jgi:endonuclease/exonuclease/phosphatase family metal-dependent hydrolase
MAIGSQRQHANDARRRAAAKRFGAVLAVIAAVVAACGPEVARGDEAGGGSPAGSGATLRIACFNAENLAAPGEETRLTRFRFEPARRRHLEKVAAVIETLVPDILVMPEVVSAAGVDAVVRILHEKGLADYRGYHVDGRDKFSGFDVAVVSRIRPDTIDGESIHLYVPSRSQGRDDEQWLQQSMTVPAPDGDEAETAGGREGRRGGTVVLQRHAAAFFTVHGRKIGVLGVHLKSNPSSVQSNAQRSAETKIVREIVRRKILAAGYLPIVLGDINDYDPDVPMADSFRKTQTTVLRDLKDLDPASEGDELVNAARFIPRVADRYTSHWDFNENGAPDGDDVFTMIDHVLVHRDLAPAIARVFICHATGLEISDHFPVVVDFDLAKLP